MKLYLKIQLAAVAAVLVGLMWVRPTSQSVHALGPWYVSPGGNDGNDCHSAVTSCATINRAISVAAPGDRNSGNPNNYCRTQA